MRPTVRGARRRGGGSSGGGGGGAFTYAESFESMTVGNSPTPRSDVPVNGAWQWSASQNRLVSTAQAASGTKALEFAYPAQPVPAEASAEMRVFVGQSLGQFWLRFWWYVPSNYVHRDVGGAGPTAKLFQFWKNNYGDYNGSLRWGVSLNRTPTNGSTMVPVCTRGNYEGVVQVEVQNFSSVYGTDFISPTGIIVPGGWYELKFYFKPATTRAATDGVWKMWVGNTVFLDGGGTLWPPLSPSGIGGVQSEDATVDRGYFMGSHNSGFFDATTFYIDDVLMTTTNPNW